MVSGSLGALVDRMGRMGGGVMVLPFRLIGGILGDGISLLVTQFLGESISWSDNGRVGVDGCIGWFNASQLRLGKPDNA